MPYMIRGSDIELYAGDLVFFNGSQMRIIDINPKTVFMKDIKTGHLAHVHTGIWEGNVEVIEVSKDLKDPNMLFKQRKEKDHEILF